MSNEQSHSPGPEQDVDLGRPVYVISIAAEISGLHPQTLRQYDRIGLVSPNRTVGRNRMYSLRDIRRLQQIQALADAGLNLVGIQRVLELEDELRELRNRVDSYEQAERSTALVVWRPNRKRW
ncbi:MAG: MerR family transcriptional regulator [Candidatus Nanopelagicales bacterium]